MPPHSHTGRDRPKARLTVVTTVRASFVIAFCVVALIAGCSRVSDAVARRDFEKANPEANIYEQFVGEGDDAAAYMHFRYTLPGSDARLEQMWLYQKQRDSSWRVVTKDGPKPAGSKFGD
jgi:hypothetical protein